MQQRQTIRVSFYLIVIALVFRLGSMGCFAPLEALFTKPETAEFLLYLQTGQVVHYTAPTLPEAQPTEPPQTEPTAPTQQERFTAADAQLVELVNQCGYEADVQALLLQELGWDLTQGGPAVLIVHSHATESFTKNGENYRESSAYRTENKDYNMVSIGKAVAQTLSQGGIEVIHDTQLHDSPSYTAAYGNSRKSVAEFLKAYPSIRLVLDLHRDAADTAAGQLHTQAMVDGKSAAQLMMVVGTDASGLYHPNWQKNMALAIQLSVGLEKAYPGITRPIHFRSQRFNQDLSPGALLVEVGAAGNTHEEALLAAQVLAQGILDMAKANSTS